MTAPQFQNRDGRKFSFAVEHHPETGAAKPFEVWWVYADGGRKHKASFGTEAKAIASMQKSVDVLTAAGAAA